MVVGNGMAGARAVEEILARGGGEQFAITMFGDEPYGNYNRIMLSHVLSGEEKHDGIFLNPFEWYVENGIDLHAPVRVTRIDRFAKVGLLRRRPGHPVRPADPGHRQPFVSMPRMEGMYAEGGGMLPGVFAFRTIDDTRSMVDYAMQTTIARRW